MRHPKNAKYLHGELPKKKVCDFHTTYTMCQGHSALYMLYTNKRNIFSGSQIYKDRIGKLKLRFRTRQVLRQDLSKDNKTALQNGFETSRARKAMFSLFAANGFS